MSYNNFGAGGLISLDCERDHDGEIEIDLYGNTDYIARADAVKIIAHLKAVFGI